MTAVSRLSSSSDFSSRPMPTQRPVIPLGRLLGVLGITPADLEKDIVSVQVSGLRHLLAEFARTQPFDPEFYAETNPDLEAARLAGIVADLHVHFVATGFFEGRLPAEPPFDPAWYANFYTDLSGHIRSDDAAALRNHFLSAGLAEGRAGTEACLTAAVASPNR